MTDTCRFVAGSGDATFFPADDPHESLHGLSRFSHKEKFRHSKKKKKKKCGGDRGGTEVESSL